LVRGEESHELWGSVNGNLSGSVNIEMSPGLGPVGLEVSLGGGTSETLMGSENFGGGGLALGFGHGEDTIWLSSLISGFLVFLGLLLGAVIGEHGSHEEVIGISLESGWDLSLVNTLFLVSRNELDVGLIIRLIIGGTGIGIELDVGSHWWSSVGSGSRDITEVLLEDLLVSVGEN
jgi:hypothetical protein